MSLLKRRSLSESRKVDYVDNNDKIASNQLIRTQNIISHDAQKNISKSMCIGLNTGIVLDRRRTSAEMISEAKSFLNKNNSILTEATVAGTRTKRRSSLSSSSSSSKSLLDIVNNVRVVHTRRPITPRETTRLLYGRVLLAERPPSAVSLRYLQNEFTRVHHSIKTPTLEPITKEMIENRNRKNADKMGHNNNNNNEQLSNHGANGQGRSAEIKVTSPSIKTGKLDMSRKLPALEPGDVTKLQIGHSTFKSNLENSCNVDQNRVIDLLNTKKIIRQNINDLLAQSSIEKLIEMLKEHAGLKECSAETVAHINTILLELYERIKKKEVTLKKAVILSGLYGLVECTAPKILLAIAKIVLALHVSGSNLTGACKLIFKVARNEQNDHLFHNDNDLLELLIDGLGRASPLEDTEACIYGYGAIRFLTASTISQECYDIYNSKEINSKFFQELPRKLSTASSDSIQTKEIFLQKLAKQNVLGICLAQHGAIQLMVLHLQMLNEMATTKGLEGRALHSLYQLTAALRAMADINHNSTTATPIDNMLIESEGTFSKHLQLACPHLIRAAELTLNEIDVQANIIRILSVLSEDTNCCHILHNYVARLGILLGPYSNKLQPNTVKEKILSSVSRLGYILGNIMAIFDKARLEFYYNDVAMEYLINILDKYSKESFTLTNPIGDNVVDALIKIIRIIANMSVNTEVGQGLCTMPALGGILLNILEIIKNMENNKMSEEFNELTLACLGALHNLCFYQEKSELSEVKTSIKDNLQHITFTLIKLLENNYHSNGLTHNDNQIDDGNEILVEVARVLGNLTRNETVRPEFCKMSTLNLLIQILNDNDNNFSKPSDLKVCIVGILVNILGDAHNRKPFLDLRGANVLLQLLKDALLQEQQQQEQEQTSHKEPIKWFLATIICQAFWNLFVDITIIIQLHADNTIIELIDLLQQQQSEQQQIQQDQKPQKHLMDIVAYNYLELCENFHAVAADLLDHLQNNIDQQYDDENMNEDKIYTQDIQNFE